MRTTPIKYKTTNASGNFTNEKIDKIKNKTIIA